MSRVLFGGKALREPTAASLLRIGVQPAVNPNATNRVAVIGPSEGGLPQTVYTFSSFGDAQDVLRSGDSLRAISYIFNPSPAYPGAAEIDFIRGDSATAATKTFNDNGGTPKAAFTITSVDKGAWVNGITVKIEGAATTRTVTIKVPGASVQTGTDGVATGTNTFSSASANFSTAQAGDIIVVTGVGTSTVYTISTVTNATTVTTVETVTVGTGLTWRHMKRPSTTTSPALAAVAGAVNVNANIVNWINNDSGLEDVITAALGASDAALVTATTGDVALAGGTVTAMTLTDIEDALELLRTRQVQHLYVARACGTGTGELSFAGALTGHILNEADVPAIAYVGAAADKSAADAISYAGALNSGRLVYLYQTAIDSAIDGLGTEEIPGYLLAAKVAGLAAGLDPQTPLTRKPISVLGIKGTALDKTARENLLKGGVLHLYQPAGSNTFVINQGITTLQNNNSLWDIQAAASSEISLMRIVDAILTDLRLSAGETFVGSTSTLAKPVIEHFVQSYLASQVGSMLQSYGSVTVTQSQDKWYVQFGMVPAYPVNFVLITGTVIA